MRRASPDSPSSDRTDALASGEGANVFVSMPFGITQLFSAQNPSGLCFDWPSRETKIILAGRPERSAHAQTTAAVRHFSPPSESAEWWMLHKTAASRVNTNL